MRKLCGADHGEGTRVAGGDIRATNPSQFVVRASLTEPRRCDSGPVKLNACPSMAHSPSFCDGHIMYEVYSYQSSRTHAPRPHLLNLSPDGQPQLAVKNTGFTRDNKHS